MLTAELGMRRAASEQWGNSLLVHFFFYGLDTVDLENFAFLLGRAVSYTVYSVPCVNIRNYFQQTFMVQSYWESSVYRGTGRS